ncbi:DsbA family oxidoreductase [Ferrimicrobium acidiphilum]|uniref:DsbA family oxidoreductase n=1 Tax=Ferrimicrobium acidiphilum TaxID=121039 RepID=UPI0023F08201|nr:DsbA family protein [Ferrimicrobium acidiphilum]
MEFAINWDYRCPFARNMHEHLITGMEDGGDYQVDFIPFSLGQVHVEEGEPDVWSNPSRYNELLAVMTGMTVQRFFPESFPQLHLALFAARHDRALDITDWSVLASILESHGLEPEKVLQLIESEGILDDFKRQHLASVEEHHVFGVPTFMINDQAAFVRVMHRPNGDAKVARSTIDRVLDTMVNYPEFNEFKYTSIPR